MDRFIKTLAILVIMLCLLAASLDLTLDRLAHSAHANPFRISSANGIELQMYRGDLNRFASEDQPNSVSMPPLLKRTKTPITPAPTQNDYRWL